MTLDPLTKQALEMNDLRNDRLASILEQSAARAATRGVYHPPPPACPCGARESDEEGRCARCGAEGGVA